MSWIKDIKKKAKALSKEKRQEILDLMWKGFTIGEAAKVTGVDRETVCGVLHINMQKRTLLNRESI
jgi:DNA-directed RNA polymerase specialized sigma24 family protein